MEVGSWSVAASRWCLEHGRFMGEEHGYVKSDRSLLGHRSLTTCHSAARNLMPLLYGATANVGALVFDRQADPPARVFQK